MAFLAGLASSLIPSLIKKAPSVLSKIADTVGDIGSSLLGAENYEKVANVAQDVGTAYYEKKTGRKADSLRDIAMDVGSSYARQYMPYDDNYIGNSGPAINANLMRQSQLNSRRIPRIYPATVSERGAGSFNPASLGELPTQRIEMYEEPIYYDEDNEPVYRKPRRPRIMY
jgi:hypothetical protein